MEGEYLYNELSGKIIGCAFAVDNELKYGFAEQVYQKALAKEFKGKDLKFAREQVMEYKYKGEFLGINRVDFLVEEKIIVELKTGKFIQQNHIHQVLNYLNSSPYELGLLILFSPQGVKVRRIIHQEVKK